MINLFYTFDKSSLELYKSFKHVKMNTISIVIEDSGYLPSDIKTPYMFFADYKIQPNDRPKFFNELEIPDYWEIHGSNQDANVFDLGEIKANIKYHSHPQPRSIHKVEWLDRNKMIRFIDYYNQYGHRFSQDVLNDEGQKVFKLYFNQNNEEIIYENITTNQIILNWHNKEYIFETKTKFIQFYLKMSGLDYSILNINSLGIPYFISMGLQKGHTNLIWQENVKDTLPGNMVDLLTVQKTRTYSILIPNKQEYKRLNKLVKEEEKSKLKLFGYTYKFKRLHQYSNNVLIATNSDHLLNFETIVKSCPEYTFNIVAITEMSNKLIEYDRYPNVKLYPKATKATFNQLFEDCDLYLDINNGVELHNAVRRAFDSNLIIYAFKESAHNLNVTSENHLFSSNEVGKMINEIKNLTDEKRNYLVSMQQKYANHISINEFINTFK